MKKKQLNHKQLRRCMCGGLVQALSKVDLRPIFTCTKCSYSFTSDADGGPYAAVVPFVIGELK